MKIGELAAQTGVPVETIRYYEHAGLLPQTARTPGNYRIYGPLHAQRLSFVRHCRNLDMTTDEIRLLLQFKDAPADNCAPVNALLDDHIDHVAHRIRELRQLEKQLKALRNQCQSTQGATPCGILNGLTQAADQATTAKPRAAGHVHGTHRGGNPQRKSALEVS